MAVTPDISLKNWFKTGLKPTQAQFWAWLDSFWHKSENIPSAQIEGLQELLDTKVDKKDIVQQKGVFDPARPYVFDADLAEYVSYINESSADEFFRVERWFRLLSDTTAGQSPETAPDKWRHIGTTLGEIAIEDVVGLREELDLTGEMIDSLVDDVEFLSGREIVIRDEFNVFPFRKFIELNNFSVSDIGAQNILRIAPRNKGSIIYVNAAATGLNDGATWANAFTSIVDAINSARQYDEIWIAGGVYKVGVSVADYINVTKSNIGIYGGFAGYELSLGERQVGGFDTIISGDLGGGLNSRILMHIGSVSNVIIDSLTFKDKSYSAAAYDSALRIVSCANVTLRHIRIVDCSSSFGTCPALYLQYSTIAIDGLEIANYQGLVNSLYTCTVYALGCSVIANNIYIHDCYCNYLSGMFLRVGSYIIENYKAENNHHSVNSYYGSALYLPSNTLEPSRVTNVILRNSIITNCSAQFGVVHVGNFSRSNLSVSGCVFSLNNSPHAIVDLWPGSGFKVEIINTTFIGNNTNGNSYDITVEAGTSGSVFIINTISQTNARSVSVEANVSGDVQIRKSKLSSGVYKSTSPSIEDYINGETTFNGYEPVEEDCYRSGDASLFNRANGAFDLLGNHRFPGNKIDLGAVSITEKTITPEEKTIINEAESHLDGAFETKHNANQIYVENLDKDLEQAIADGDIGGHIIQSYKETLPSRANFRIYGSYINNNEADDATDVIPFNGYGLGRVDQNGVLMLYTQRARVNQFFIDESMFDITSIQFDDGVYAYNGSTIVLKFPEPGGVSFILGNDIGFNFTIPNKFYVIKLKYNTALSAWEKIIESNGEITSISHPVLTASLTAHDFSTGFYEEGTDEDDEPAEQGQEWWDETNNCVYRRNTNGFWIKIYGND